MAKSATQHARELHEKRKSAKMDPLEIVESTDHFLQKVYHIKDGIIIRAICYSCKDAETVKAALEDARKKEESEGLHW